MSQAATPAVAPVNVIGVGIDTARYGHHVSFLAQDQQTGEIRSVAAPFRFAESKEGYQKLQRQLEKLHRQWPAARLLVRLDLAGQYGANLERFLRQLAVPLSFSTGDPLRNRAYRIAHYPKRKTDPAESLCVARFAAVEQPPAQAAIPVEMEALRAVAARLLAISKRQTQHANQLHNLLARVFPELPPLVNNLRNIAVLQLLQRFPTPDRLAKAKPDALAKVRYLKAEKLAAIQQAAADSVAYFTGAPAAALVRSLVDDLRRDRAELLSLRQELVKAYGKLPRSNHVETIPGIGVSTAAAITAKVVDIGRFASAPKLVAYFGVFPERDASGVDPDGTPRGDGQAFMSRKGNDLVRAYLYNCARSAVRYNPVCRELFARLKARGRTSNVAFGHVMAKLLRLAYAVWKTDRPFDPNYQANRGKSKDKEKQANAAGHTPS
jgi:transposase